MSDSALGLLVKQMEEEKQSSAEALLAGAAGDFAKYKEMCGYIRGLATAQVLVQAMNDRLVKENNG